jgi:hypothetical protein
MKKGDLARLANTRSPALLPWLLVPQEGGAKGDS